MPVPSPAEEAASLLEARPHSVRAHVLMGDHYAAAGDDQQAIYYFRQALRFAEVQDLADADVERARRTLSDFEAGSDARRQARLAPRGLPPAKWSPRFAEALDIA